MEPTQPKPLAKWNTARDVWEKPEAQNIICGHSDVYSETFPTSGSMRNGAAYQLPTKGPRTHATERSSLQPGEVLLRTPTASEVGGGMMHPEKAREEGRTLRLSSQMVQLATPAN